MANYNPEDLRYASTKSNGDNGQLPIDQEGRVSFGLNSSQQEPRDGAQSNSASI